VSGDSGRPSAYLDHAATSPVRPEVAEAMAPFAAERFGHASGAHGESRAARLALEEARDEVAALLGAQPRELVFTSGGTEAANLAVQGVLRRRVADGRPAGVFVHSAVEHPAVLECARAAARGALLPGGPVVECRPAPVDAAGAVDVDALDALLGPEVSLVSIMLANNEVGTVQPLTDVAAAVGQGAPGALLHTDAVQAAATMDLIRHAAPAHLVSVSAHKLGGPKGSGALVVRHGVALAPLFYGGGQEHERRSGTHDVAGAVGLAVALRTCAAQRMDEVPRLQRLRDRLADGLTRTVDGLTETVPRHQVLPGHCHVLVAGVEQEELLVLLDRGGVCAAAGAACASGALGPSHVLTAMGVPDADARGAVRFTLGYTTTEAEVDLAVEVTAAAVRALRRSLAPHTPAVAVPAAAAARSHPDRGRSHPDERPVTPR
jgi:cysteine desulfurase